MPELRGQSLFATPPSFGDMEKSASARLSRDSKNWPEEVMDVLHQTQPYLANYNINVRMNKTDADSGHGVGAVNIDDRVIIPVIVADCRLAPLDVFIHEDNVLPLTRPALEEALQSGDTLGEPVKPGSLGETTDASLAYLTLPPFDGKYAYASLDYDEEQLKLGMARLTGAQLEWGIATSPVFEDVLRSYAANVAVFEDEVTKVAAEIVELGKGSSKHITEPGVYKVATDKGDKPGFVAHNVYYFDLDDVREGMQAFVGLDKTASFTDRPMYGYPYKGGGSFKTNDAWRGTGVFVFLKEADTIVTEPVNIVGRLGDDYLATVRGGANFRLRKVASEYPLQKVAGELRPTFLLNDEWLFVNVDDLAQPTSMAPTNPADAIGAATITKVGGYARLGDGSTVHISDLRETLASRYDDVFVSEAIDTFTKTGSVSFIERPATPSEEIRVPRLTNEQLTALWKTAALAERAIYAGERSGLLKLATSPEEMSRRTVDAVLGLNFLNEQNILKFVESIDSLREARRAAAQLLIASRIGLEVDSSPIRTALFALDSVIRDLTELRNVTYSK